MKKLLSVLLIFSMLFGSVVWAAQPPPGLTYDGEVIRDNVIQNDSGIFDFEELDIAGLDPGKVQHITDYGDFRPASQKWKDYTKNIKPATFSKVSYKLADNVVKVNGDVTENLKSMGQLLAGGNEQKFAPSEIIRDGGFIKKDLLEKSLGTGASGVKIGTVVVDESNGVAFKVVSPTEFGGIFESDSVLDKMVEPLRENYALTMPELHEIIEDFELEEDTVELTAANIVEFGQGMEDCVTDFPEGTHDPPEPYWEYNLDSEKGFKKISRKPFVGFEFKDTEFEVKASKNSKVKIVLSGGFGIDKVNLTGSYSAFGGYSIGVSLEQEGYLVVEMAAEVNEEVRIPLVGVEVPFGVGRISGGLYLILGLDGKFRLDIIAREYIAPKAGITGGTAFCIPTSVRPYIDTDMETGGDVRLLGQLNAYMKIGLLADIRIFGFDLVGAGVLLGAGVKVEKDLSMLDIHLYAILNVYFKFMGKRYNILNLQPTLKRKRQTDTGGHMIVFKEVYVAPSRVGGVLYKQDAMDSKDPLKPAPYVDFKIHVVPEDVYFDVNYPEQLNNPKIRHYPENSFKKTNQWGEFIVDEAEGVILSEADRVIFEFRPANLGASDRSYFSSDAKPVLPFTDVTISFADCFNHFALGRVEPIKTINWHDNKQAVTYMLSYYEHMPVFIQGANNFFFRPEGGTAYLISDARGFFDTRQTDFYGKLSKKDSQDQVNKNKAFRVMPWSTFESTIYSGSYVTLDDSKDATTFKVRHNANLEISFSRVVDFVEDSYERYEEGDKLIDKMEYDEYIFISNALGSEAPQSGSFRIFNKPISTQDFTAKQWQEAQRHYEYQDESYQFSKEPDWSYDKSPYGSYILQPVNDKNGKPTNTSVFHQRVTVEWVWQPHPKPVTIESPDKGEVVADGEDGFAIITKGFAPFKYTLTGAPKGVGIFQDGKNTFMRASPDVKPGNYNFTIRAEEDRVGVWSVMPERIKNLSNPIKAYYEGHDASPPYEQKFTLTVLAPPEIPEPEQEIPEPEGEEEVGPEPEPDQRQTPCIMDERHEYSFTRNDMDIKSVQVRAEGSTPISWSIIPTGSRRLPDTVSINPASGLLFLGDDLGLGTYYFTIKAENDVGVDTKACTLKVISSKKPPTINEDDHNFSFFHRAGEASRVLLTAEGDTPITWSLVGGYMGILPAGLSIDESTGLLIFGDNMVAGNYSFSVKAENEAGYDIRECTLQVKVMPIIKISKISSIIDKIVGTLVRVTPCFALDITDKNNITDILIDGAAVSQKQYFENFESYKNVSSKVEWLPPSMSAADQLPTDIYKTMNKVTLRWDDKKDVYTHDRFTVNGAQFVKWNSYPGVGVVPVPYAASGFVAGSGAYFRDNSPKSDRYHYYGIGTGPEGDYIRDDPEYFEEAEIGHLKDAFEITLNSILKDYIDGRLSNIVGEDFSSIFANSPLYSVSTIVGDPTRLNYTETIDAISKEKGGNFKVDLGQRAGTHVVGKYFDALKNNKNGVLTFSQDGFLISFQGKNIKQASQNELYNFAFYDKAFHEDQLLDAGRLKGDLFTFAFAHHGELPGKASFEVQTTLTPGLKVNLYMFGPEDASFTLIVKDATIDDNGVLAYENNRMSEYVVTTQVIEGAAVVAAEKYGGHWLIILIAMAVIALLGGAYVIISRRRAS